jgi:hypothetical protein
MTYNPVVILLSFLGTLALISLGVVLIYDLIVHLTPTKDIEKLHRERERWGTDAEQWGDEQKPDGPGFGAFQ